MSKQKTVLNFFSKIQNVENKTKTERQSNIMKDSTSASESLTNDPAHGLKSVTLIDGPYQPKNSFKTTVILGKSRSFKESWYKEFSWLEYSCLKDAAFCFPCRLFCKEKSGRNEVNFTMEGVSNWKKALEKFKKHEKSEMHLTSMQFWKEAQKCKVTITEKLSNSHSKSVEENRNYVKFIIESILFLGKQGLPFRGHDESISSQNKGNFLELLELRANDKGEEMTRMMKSHINSYTSGQIQNDILSLLKNDILQSIVQEINRSSSFSLICDETTDISSKEQLSICIRYAFVTDESITIKERFLGFIDVNDTTGLNLFVNIKKYVEENGLDIKKIRGQAYDGAANMSGKFNGVAAKFKEIEPRALYTHCHAHLLDLAVVRFCQDIKPLRNALNVINSLYCLISTSAKRFAIFEEICKQNSDSKFRKITSLSKTRWTVRHRALISIIEQLPDIIETLENISNDSNNPKISSEADGLLKFISKFEFVFCLKFLYRMLSLTDVLSKELQSKTIDIISIFPKAQALINCFLSERTEKHFDKIWKETETICQKVEQRGYEIESPSLPRKKKVPKKLDNESANAYFHSSPENVFKTNIYFAGLDLIACNLKCKFSENDYSKIEIISSLLLKFTDELNENNALIIKNFYSLSSSFIPQLIFYRSYAKSNFPENCSTIIGCAEAFLKNKLAGNAPLVFELFEIALSWPITTASAERSFSSLRRLKTYLRSTMGEDRLNSLALLNIEQDLTKKISENENLDRLVEKFACSNRRIMLY